MVSTTTTVAPGQLLQYRPVTDAKGNPKKLGQGAYGAVYEYVDTVTGESVAIKRIHLTGLQGNKACVLQKHLPSELQELHKLHYPHIVKLKDVFMTSDHINIVQELVTGGTLLHCVNRCLRRGRPMGEESARWIFQQLLVTIEYFHKHGLRGRAFDHDNILLLVEPGLRRPLIKVADFGLSKHLDALPSARLPDVRLMCPEAIEYQLWRSDVSNTCSSAKADIWRAGIILHELLTGEWPWPSDGLQDRAWHICWSRPLPKLHAGLSTDCKHLLEALLHPVPEARITVAAIKRHPWFLKDLPTAAADMADHYIDREPTCVRSVEQLQAIVQEAVQAVAAASSSCS